MRPTNLLDALADLCFALSTDDNDDLNQLAGEMLMSAADLTDPNYILAAMEKANEQIQPSS